jgi:hypothetical protein
MTTTTDRCWLCDGPPPEVPRDQHGGVKFAAVPERLCSGHQSMFDRMAAEEQERHPDGRCTSVCGCVPLAEMEQRLTMVKMRTADGRHRTRIIRSER